MRSLRARFILSHVLPILLIVPFVGTLLVYLLETQILLTDLTTRLTEEAALIAETISANPNLVRDETTAGEYVARLDFVLEGEVILLQSDGSLLASSAGESGFQPDKVFQLDGLEKALAGEQSVTVTHGWFQQKGEVLIPIKGLNEKLIGIVGIAHAVEGVASRFERLRWLVLVILGIELLLGFLIGLLLALRLERPIERAANAVIEIAAGDYIEPIPESGPKDIQRLSASINSLSERLRILEESRRNLLANIVHELGRPLGAILAAIHVLRQKAGEEPEIRDELLAGIENEIQRMQPLLDDLAQLHGQVLGNLQLDQKPVALNDWLPPLLLPWRAAAREKDLEWTATLSPNLPTVSLDADRMAQVVGNLLSNAIKYTPEGGSVSVTVSADQMEVRIRVSDTGPGINPEERERIFEPFFRSQQQHRFPQGLGLGLTIARDIVEAHGGHLELNSSPGEGSQFTIYLPLTAE
jgi:signal transduction histidine kinase